MKKYYFLLFSLAIVSSAFALTPANPTNVKWFDNGDESGYSKLSFTLPSVDVDGNTLDPEMMGYRIYTDDDQIFTFESSVYSNDNLWGDVTNIYYYQWSEGIDITSDYVYFYRTNSDGYERFFNTRIGIQVFYLDESFQIGGVSDIVYAYLEPQPVVIHTPKNPLAECFYEYGADMAEFGANTFQYQIFPEDVDGNPLDPEKLSFSIFTDFDEIYTFNAATYYADHNSEFWADGVDKTELPYLIADYDPFFDIWDTPFFQSTDPSLPANERLFQWRIGLQVYYTDGGVKTSSDIVYVQLQDENYSPPYAGVFPKPVSLLGDVNEDGKTSIQDVTTLIEYLLGGNPDPFNKFNADVNDDNKHSITDVTSLINLLLNGGGTR